MCAGESGSPSCVKKHPRIAPSCLSCWQCRGCAKSNNNFCEIKNNKHHKNNYGGALTSVWAEKLTGGGFNTTMLSKHANVNNYSYVQDGIKTFNPIQLAINRSSNNSWNLMRSKNNIDNLVHGIEIHFKQYTSDL